MNSAKVCGGDFEATITRSLFGVSYGLNYGFPDAVRVVIQVEASSSELEAAGRWT